MRFHGSGSYEQGVADVDPVAAPATILLDHFIDPKYTVGRNQSMPEEFSTLYLVLLGTGAETLTLDLYFLIENLNMDAKPSEYQIAATRWLQFATGVIVTNGTLQTVTSGLPRGGTIYGRRTADAITAGQTRKLLVAWK